MEFVSLRTIIYDLLEGLKYRPVLNDETTSLSQLESWIHKYRALFLKRDLDRGVRINPSYVQHIDNLSLIYDEDMEMYCTEIEIPRPLNLANKSGIMYVGDNKGNQIQLVPENRIFAQKNKRITQDDTLAFFKNFKLYIYNPKGLSYVSIKGVFEIPPAVYEVNNEEFTMDSYYPLPLDKVEAIQLEIIKKLFDLDTADARKKQEELALTNNDI